ncbi:MAG: flippase-like domain-containing protein [Proteobacteria bacterium]|nr:flippase-like domain-containing protein [Pseudomonadota bacterium]
MKRYMKYARFVSLALGAALLTALVQKIGWQNILANVTQLGWRFVPILGISGLWYVLYTIAWMQFLGRIGDGIGFLDLFKIKVSGEAVNTLTPANFIGGDPMRIYMLKRSFGVSQGAASVVVDRTLQILAVLITILLGVIVAFLAFDSEISDNIAYGVPIALTVSLAFMAFLLVHQRRGLFSMILRILRGLGIRREFSEKTVRRFEELDSHIIDFYSANHAGFLAALACHIGGRLLGVLEIYAIGRAVSDEFSLFAALMLSALAPMISVVFAFIPGAFGVMEGAFSGLLYLLHIDPSIGITIQIAKRLRAALWIGLGLLFLGAHNRNKVFDEEGMLAEAEQAAAEEA